MKILKNENGYYYIHDGKKRDVKEVNVLSVGIVYADMQRHKRCDCGTLVYWAITEKGKIIDIHKAVSGYASHKPNCSWKYRKARSNY